MSYEQDPGYQHGPYPCSARVEIDRPQGFVGHWLPGQNPLLPPWPGPTGRFCGRRPMAGIR